MKKDFQLTKEGVQELGQELDELIASRTVIAKKIKIARDFGDLSENAEYHAARDEQVSVELRIEEIQNILKSVDIIEGTQPTDTVTIGNTVDLEAGGKKVTYTVVGSVEADPLEGKISTDSPIGSALLDKKKGEEVVISLPVGETTYTIKSIK